MKWSLASSRLTESLGRCWRGRRRAAKPWKNLSIYNSSLHNIKTSIATTKPDQLTFHTSESNNNCKIVTECEVVVDRVATALLSLVGVGE